jgi:beta-glucosidase
MLPPIARDPSQPLDARVDDLLAALTLDEKIAQMQHATPAIDRLGIPAYSWWNECSHGVARAGRSTVYPHAIAHAATWNVDLLDVMGQAIAKEGRAKHNEAANRGDFGDCRGLTCWTPNINIVRDPRWGRSQETYGEDPTLTAQLAVAFIRALQGDHPEYYQLTATAKHFAAHSGPEGLRHEFNVEVTAYDLWDTYLPAFEACVKEAGVESIMPAYTRLNGEACCASPTLLESILRDQWGFTGHIVSDCGALEDIYKRHRLVETEAEAAALALNAGCDLNCGTVYSALGEALERGLIDEATIDRSLRRLLRARFRLGLFDPPERVPFNRVSPDVIGCDAHATLARRVACESIVLLKNDGSLPLTATPGKVAVIGPNADDPRVLLGNYHGEPPYIVSPLDGIRRVLGDEVTYERGCDVIDDDTSGYRAALDLAAKSDLVIFVGGLSQIVEGENMQDENVPAGTVSRGDRESIELPRVQQALLDQLQAVGTPIVLVLVSGSAVSVPDDNLRAVLMLWYAGQEGGNALADVLFGKVNPAGRLPMTIYQSTNDLPPLTDYAMDNRTYRYFTGTPRYPFGHGLSYTTFAYSDLAIIPGADGSVEVQVTVANSGDCSGDEVVQVYVQRLDGEGRAPRIALQSFQRITLDIGTSQIVRRTLSQRAFTRVTEDGTRVFEPGRYRISVGGGQPGTGAPVIQADLSL